MALSGIFSQSAGDHWKVQVEWTATQSIANNTSTITAKLYWIASAGGALSGRPTTTGNIVLDGTTTNFSGNTNVTANQKKLIGTATKTVTHNGDGVRYFALSGMFNGITASILSIQLNTIPRKSSFSLSVAWLQSHQSGTVTIARESTTFTHTVKFTFGNVTWSKTGVATSTTFRPNDARTDAEWASVIGATATSISGTVTVSTYSGSTLIGSNTSSVTIYIRDDNKPTIGSMAITDTVSTIANLLGSGRFAQNQSNIQMAVTGMTAGAGTTIDYVSITCDGRTNRGNWTFGKPTKAQPYIVNWTVYDKRGRTATGTTTFLSLAYAAPKITNFKGTRATNVNLNLTGTISSLTNASATQVNKYTIIIKRKLQQSIVYENFYTGTTTTGTSFTLTPIDTTADIEKSYQYQATVTDALGVSTTSTLTISTLAIVMHWAKTGIGVGKYWENGALDVGGDSYLRGKVRNLSNGAGVLNIGTDTFFEEWYPRGMADGRAGWSGFSSATSYDMTVLAEKGRLLLRSLGGAVRMQTSNGNDRRNWEFGSINNGRITFHVLDSGPVGSSLKFFAEASAGLQARNADDSGFIPIAASAFNVNSQREMKHGIEPFVLSEMGNTALEEVRATPVYKYHYHEDTENEIKRTGVIIDTAPLDIISLDGVGIDAYQMISLAYKAIQELSAKNDELENRVLALEEILSDESNRDE